MDLLNIILLGIGIFTVFYYYLKRITDYYKGTDVKYIEPPFPYVGSNIPVFLGFEHLQKFTKRCYDAFPNERYIGLCEPGRPVIMIRDVNLIKQIGIKEFDSFHDHRSVVDEKMDPMFGRNLFALKGNTWRDMRSTLSPAFSSSKMRNMFSYIEECAREMTNYYIKECDKYVKKTIEIEVKDTFSRYTVDVIATSAFGIKTNSIQDKDNEFFTMGKSTINFTFTQMIKMSLFLIFPKISKFVNIPLFRPHISRFFKNLISGTMKTREENNIVRHDMIHLLMEAKKGNLKHETESKDSTETGFATVEESSLGKQTIKRQWDDDDFAAQALIFFIGGFDTTSTALTFFFYEVCKNPDIMTKLQNEIDDCIAEAGDSLTYATISQLKYLDMCVSETLRKWPPAANLDRVCSKSFTLPPPNEKSTRSYEVKENMAVWFPVYALHYDENYFPNPEVFDPERFSDENKSSIEPGAYIPFGIGPRNCIGSRYALLVVKSILFHIFAKMDVHLSNKTDDPLILNNVPFNLSTKNGVWVHMTPRKK